MKPVIIRYQFDEENTARNEDLMEFFKSAFGAGFHFLAAGTVFAETDMEPEELFNLLSEFFTFDDKLFVGRLDNFHSLHHISRTRAAFARIAI